MKATIKRAASGKISLKLCTSDYVAFCGLVHGMTVSLAKEMENNRLKTQADLSARLQFLTILRLHKRLSKSDYYPLVPGIGQTPRDTMSVSMEMPEALVFWFLMIESNLDESNPTFQLIGQQLHRLLL